MNYDDYYARQVGGALPYFTGARVQKGHGFGSLVSGLLRSIAPLIKRGALALGKRVLTTGAQIAGDVVDGQSIKKATKRRATAAGRALGPVVGIRLIFVGTKSLRPDWQV